MHIDHKKFIELLTDASGIETEKVEKQITELVEEIQLALADGEAYEIEGFGIFSGIGNRVLFIPSKELETEVNFKYVGMEPIELEEDVVHEETSEQEEDPFEGLQEELTGRKRDPFAGLVEDFDEDKPEQSVGEEEPRPGPEEWGIEAHKEDNKGANRLLSSLMGEEFDEESAGSESELRENDESESEDGEVVEDEVTFDDIFGETSSESDLETKEDSVSGLDAELANLMSDETEDKSEEELSAGIMGSDFADIFGGSEENPEDQLELDDEEEDEAIDELIEELEQTEEEEAKTEELLSDKISEEIVQEEEPVKPEEAETEPQEPEPVEEEPELMLEDDFDDPFLDLEDLDEEEEKPEAEDIIPVITNISSDLDPVKKEEPLKEKKEKKQKKKKEQQPAPVFLWIILALVLIVGATVGLGYFSIINIPGITPQIASNITPPPVVTPQPVQEQAPTPVQQEETTVPSSSEVETPVQEQETEPVVPVSTETSEVPVEQAEYGMMGTPDPAANDGYTVVLYSLSIEANAFAKQSELSNDGYRALVTPISSVQYGTLWRVSIGQFASLTDAAIAAEDMPAEYKQSYFIKRISN